MTRDVFILGDAVSPTYVNTASNGLGLSWMGCS